MVVNRTLQFGRLLQGTGMSDETNYRGILYSIRCITGQHWKWEIAPPEGVKGLRREGGEIFGQKSDAMAAVRKAIEDQTGQYFH